MVNKIQRWALSLSRFSYTIELIEGANNVMADKMTRWYAGYRGIQSSVKRITTVLKSQDIVQSPERMELEWPDTEAIRIAKSVPDRDVPDSVIDQNGTNNDEWENMDPSCSDSASDEANNYCTCDRGGHRGHERTLSVLKEH